MSPLSSPPPVVIISQDPGIVTVIERFDVPADRQKIAAQAGETLMSEAWAKSASFVAAVLLRSRNGSGLACYSQWTRSPAKESQEPTAPWQSLSSALTSYATLDSRVYSVEFSGHPVSVAPPTLVSMERTPHAHFGIFSVTLENQNRMVDRARASAPKSLETPGLTAINFHRSLDGLRVVNFGLWSSLDQFDALVQQPGFKEDDLYWMGIADFQPDFFDVVAITTATVTA